jgi:hypothetical protein
MAESVEGTRGQGEAIVDPHHSRRDLAMMRRAIAGEWEIPEKLRMQFVEVASKIYQDEEEDSRARVAAGKLILTANEQNQKSQGVGMSTPTTEVTQVNNHVNVQVKGVADDLLPYLGVLRSISSEPAQALPRDDSQKSLDTAPAAPQASQVPAAS